MKKHEMLVRALADAHQRAEELAKKDPAFASIEAHAFEALQQAIAIQREARNARAQVLQVRYGLGEGI